MNNCDVFKKPQLRGVSVVAKNILQITFQEGIVRGGVQIPYEPMEGETLEVDKLIPDLVYIVKDGNKIGVKVPDRQKGTQRFPYEYVEGERLNTQLSDDIRSYKINGKSPIKVYRKTKPNNIADPIYQYTYLHKIYLVLSDAVKEGEELLIEFEGSLFDVDNVSVVFESASLMSEAIHTNQVGYRRDDPCKKAYLSLWIGLGGGIYYDDVDTFYVIDNKGNKLYEGKTTLNDTGEVFPIGNAEVSSNSPIYELDFSDFDLDGEFKIMIPGIGCSFPFIIDETQTWQKGFRATMNALYCQRSGIVTGKPYTQFERPRVYHPDDGRVVYQSKCSLFASGNGLNCYGTDVNNFENLLRGATDEVVENAWGGYFDACDWDRRIQHLRASRLHTELYIMAPEYFNDIKLPIPESGNGIPDILNEACFNIDFYKRLQLPNGGIRGGIEAEEHPILGQCGWQDTWKAYAYAPDFWSSYYYASTAARMAFALKNINTELSKEYEQSAEKAFEYAEKTYLEALDVEGHKWTRRAHKGVVTERQNAASDLFRLTLNAKYEKIYLAIKTDDNFDAAFVYATLPTGIGSPKDKINCKDLIIKMAQKVMENAELIPFRLTSEDMKNERVGTWGRFCTIPRNTQLIRAHYLTGEDKYLKAAIAGAEFAAGANPDNMCFTTGVGIRYPEYMLHHDSRMTGQKPPVGITVMGPQDFNHPDDALPRLLRADFLWPGAYTWPTFEGYLDIYRHPCVTEYTVQENIGPNGYQWGYFASRASKKKESSI